MEGRLRDQPSAVPQPILEWIEHAGIPEALRRHALEVGGLLAEWGADAGLVQAGMLHEIVYQGLIEPDAVRASAGSRVAELCIFYAQVASQTPPTGWRGHPRSLRRTRIFAAAYQQPEVALLCAAHMWHSVVFPGSGSALARNVSPRSPSSPSGPSHGTPTSLALSRADVGSVLLPVLEMLGLGELRHQLEDHPAAAATLGSTWLQDAGAEAAALARTLEDALLPQQPQATVLLRYRPVLERASNGDRPGAPADQRSNLDRGAVQQSFAIRVIVPTIAACYQALEIVHHLHRPIEGAVQDTTPIAQVNGYRSLRTAVVTQSGGSPVRLHIEIVTPEMDLVNRWGVAAFIFDWLRSQLGAAADDKAWESAWWQGAASLREAIRATPMGALADSVLVFSPRGELFVFQRGSTVVDFAYSVHSDLAEQCQRFFINGETVEPATVLRHLDLVELEHSPRAPGPTLAWLNAARTKRARTRIRRYLRRQSEGVGAGQRILQERLHTLEEYYGFHIADHRVEEATTRTSRQQGMVSAADFLAQIAVGRASADRLLHPLFAEELVRRIDIPRALRLRPHQLTLAQCCKPRPGDDIVGLPNQRSGVVTRMTVHTQRCPSFLGLSATARAAALPLRWRLRSTERTLAQIDMTARADDGLLGMVLATIYSVLPRVTLIKVDASARRGTARLRFSLESEAEETIEEIADALRRLPGHEVSAVRVLALPPSEQEALQAEGQASSNPYSRMPVHDPTMFFGRRAELERVNEWLHNNVSCVWLRGQKRVGKTSLLLHLKNHFWDSREAICAFVDFQLISNLAQANIFYEVASAVHADLERDPRVAGLGAPERALFAQDPPQRLLAYLRLVQQRLGARRLVILLDEFSRITDLYLGGQIAADFFQQWRGLLQAAGRGCVFVTVVQQKTFERMVEYMRTQRDDPCWHVLELGETLQLKPFEDDDARRLIEWPMRNFVDYSPQMVERVRRLTGGSPFLIQAFCNKLVAQMAREGLSEIETAQVSDVIEEFMQPSESLFAHLLDVTHGLANFVVTHLALAAGEDDERIFAWEEVQRLAPEASPATLRRTLDQLCASHVLVQVDAEQWRFTSSLFQRWLARNSQ